MARRDAQGGGKADGAKAGRGTRGEGGRPAPRNNDRPRLVGKLIAEDPSILGPPQITTKIEGDQTIVHSASHGIKTVDDLLAHIEADLTKFEVAASEATVWESPCGDAKVPLYRVWVRLKPRGGPGVLDAVRAMLDGAAASMAAPLLAGAVARIALRRLEAGETGAPGAVRPLYVRRPDVELVRSARRGQEQPRA